MRWQYSLRGLFYLTTAAAMLAWLFASFEPVDDWARMETWARMGMMQAASHAFLFGVMLGSAIVVGWLGIRTLNRRE